MKFFKRMDEMELAISLKAMRLAWVFSNSALVVWSIVSMVRDETPTVASIILIIILGQNAVFFATQAYLHHGMTKSRENE